MLKKILITFILLITSACVDTVRLPSQWPDTNFIIPVYQNEPYYIINEDIPYFTEEDLHTETFETYSDLDQYGRCGVAFARLGEETMPTSKRESIRHIRPSGWQRTKYPFIENELLYNRCHLIAFSLAAENANPLNLITGTHYFNVEVMLPLELQVLEYIRRTKNHVLYRVTPIFEQDNLIATGIILEAYSIEDRGKAICFNRFCFNVQPGVEINYKTGKSRLKK